MSRASLLALLCCLVAGAARAEPVVPRDTVITLERGGCERRCPVYKVSIRADGSVLYEGRHYVRRAEKIRDRIAPGEVKKLVEEFTGADFFNLRDDYGVHETALCEPGDTDAPIVSTSIVSGGRAKTVVHHHRCGGEIPARLSVLERRIDEAAQTRRWVR